MAYKRRYKKQYKKKQTPWYNQKYSVGDIASTALKGVKTLQGIINSEKHFYNKGAQTTVVNTGSVVSCCDITQNDLNSGRNGNSILMKSLTGGFTIQNNSLTTASFVRVIFFLDLQQIADTTPVRLDILESDYLSQLRMDTLGRFKILSDYKVIVDNASKPYTYKPINIRTDHHIRYNGGASTDIQKGGLYMLILSDQATNLPTLTYNFRIGFYDN